MKALKYELKALRYIFKIYFEVINTVNIILLISMSYGNSILSVHFSFVTLIKMVTMVTILKF